MNPWKQLALLAVMLACFGVTLACYSEATPVPCDPHCADLPNPVGWHRYKWERDKLRDAGIEVSEPYGSK